MENGPSENQFVFSVLLSPDVGAFHTNKAKYGSEKSKTHAHHQQPSGALDICCMRKKKERKMFRLLTT